MTIRNAIGAVVLAALMVFMISHSDAARAWQVCLDQACVAARAASAPAPATTAAVAVTPAAATAPTAPTPTDFKSLLDKLVNVDGPAAIARAQACVDNPKTPDAEKIYCAKRAVCYATIVAIAPDVTLLDVAPAGTTAGILDKFEVTAEVAEGVNTALVGGLNKVDIARFETDCGWIGQRAGAIAANIGMQIVNLANGLALLAPK